MMFRLCILVFLFLFSSVASAARNDVLVIVNDNSNDSVELGQYYAQSRDIAADNIVHVRVTTDYYIKWPQFLVLRDQIIKHIQNHIIPGTSTPAVCSGTESPYYCQASIDQIRNETNIKYLVTTRDIPTRLFVGSSESMPTSLDSYLRSWLINYVTTESIAINAMIRAGAYDDGDGMREVIPATDGELIIGRIDGVTLNAARQLVDRTIDAESNGIYGKLYGSQFGSTGGEARWWNYNTNSDIYGNSLSEPKTAWRYQHGMFGPLNSMGEIGVRYTDNSDCLTHIEFSAGSAEGKSPTDCVVKLTRGQDAAPARNGSRQALADDALVYLGSLDGQPTTGSFSQFLNWHKNTSCNVTLCEDAADPAQCRLQSTDPYGEINTACVGVADGFIGYNFQSYPVSFLHSWPTGWYQSTSNNPAQWAHLGGGDVSYLGLPVVKDDTGSDDNYSLWYLNSPKLANEKCYSDSSTLDQPASTSCRHDSQVILTTHTNIDSTEINAASPQTVTVNFDYKAQGILNTNTNLYLQMTVREVAYDDGTTVVPANNQVVYPRIKAVSLPAGDTPLDPAAWQTASVQFTLDPSLHINPQKLFNGIKIRLTSSRFEGNLGIDNVSIVRSDSPGNLAANGSFNQGHKQVSAGDHAANFLNRLNGVGFWGSTSHFATGGHSFDNHPMDTLIYFLRGLNLGNSVWFAENRPSGILYGDPLYSPIAIRLHPVATHGDNYVDVQPVQITGDVVNGTGPNVTTGYSIEYCAGNDFFDCDQGHSWLSTGLAGTGGSRSQNLGSWNPSSLTPGPYVLRLSVTSNNSVKNTSQTFYDYQVVNVFVAANDDDGDGLNNGDELIHGTRMDLADTDGDGLSDYQEIVIYNTDPLDSDSDNDQLSDGEEINIGTDPNNVDSDGDGFQDGAEVAVGMDPLTADILANPWIGTLTGRVTTPEGEGVAGLTFWDISKYPATITTDERGYFVARGYVGGETVWFNTFQTGTGFSLSPSGWNGQPFTHTGGAVTARNFTATQVAGSVSGKVTLENGDPLSGITFWDVTKYPATVTTNADGRFISTGYAAGDTYWFNTNATNSGYTLVPNGWSGQPGQHDGSAITAIDYLATQNPGTLSGRITTPDGQPVPGLTFWDVTKYPQTVTTGADGRYMIQDYTAGDWVWLNMYNASTDYELIPSNWSGGSFQHDGSAIRFHDFIAVPK